MPLRVVVAEQVPPQPWRNGGGSTRELIAWPGADDWRVRVSVADVERDGPFSRFEGVERWFVVLEGAGVRLRWSDRAVLLGPGDAPLRFDGGVPPDCALVAGPTRDLNLMVRGGDGRVDRVEPRIAWTTDLAWRAVFATQPGTLRAGDDARPLAAGALAWDDDARGREWALDGEGWWLAAPAG